MTFSVQDLVPWVGYAAGLCLAVANLPQLLKVWRSKSADDLSFRMLVLLVGGLSLWILFGLLKQDWPIIVGNGMSLVLASTLLALKVRYG